MIRGALAEAWQGEDAWRFAPPAPAAPQVAGALLERYGDGDRPLKSAEELDALVERLRATGFAWEKVSTADRVDIVWVLWRGDDPPADHDAFRLKFLAWIEAPWRRVQARRLASSWAAAFDPARKSIREIGAWLAPRAARLGEPWAALAEAHDIFAPEEGPPRLARAYLRGSLGALNFWTRLRLPARAASGGFALATLGALASEIEPRLAAEPALATRLIDFAQSVDASSTSAVGPARIAAIRVHLAEALLRPWRQSAPPTAVKDKIIAFLLREYEDPRVRREAWEHVAPEAVKILRDWLNREAITLFFRLAARGKDATRRDWQAREQFWLKAMDQLEDAWLILGSASESLIAAGDGRFGRLVGCGAEHAALLLKLKGLTIVQSTNAEHERIWVAGNQQVPPRYYGRVRSYSAATLTTGADFSSSYATAEAGAWQRRLCDFIGRHTSIALARG